MPADSRAEARPLLCSSCSLAQRKGSEHQDARACIAALTRTAKLLVDKIGVPRACSGCQATIYMIEVRDDKARGGRAKKPYDANGQSHFLSCPAAGMFYR